MMPMVLYSGKTTRSMPGKPIFMPSTMSAIARALCQHLGLACAAAASCS